MTHPRRRWMHRQGESGVAAVEGALVLSVLMVPLLMGVLKFGDIFYRSQAVDLVTPPMVQTDKDGNPFWVPNGDCSTLANRIKQSLINSLVQTNSDLFGGNSSILNNMTVTVTKIPDQNAVYVNAGLQPVLTEWVASHSSNDAYKNWANDWSGIVRNAWVEVPAGSGSCRA